MKCKEKDCKFMQSQQSNCKYCLGCGIRICLDDEKIAEEEGMFKHGMELDEEKKEDE